MLLYLKYGISQVFWCKSVSPGFLEDEYLTAEHFSCNLSNGVNLRGQVKLCNWYDSGQAGDEPYGSTIKDFEGFFLSWGQGQIVPVHSLRNKR